MPRCILDDQKFTISFPTFFGHLNGASATQVIGGGAAARNANVLIFQKLIGCSLIDDLTTVPPGTGANVEDKVRFEHHVLVVLNNQNSVAQIAQVFQRVDQFHIVALVQTDTRFVHDVQHAHQLRSDLGSQPDTLRFATRQRP